MNYQSKLAQHLKIGVESDCRELYRAESGAMASFEFFPAPAVAGLVATDLRWLGVSCWLAVRWSDHFLLADRYIVYKHFPRISRVLSPKACIEWKVVPGDKTGAHHLSREDLTEKKGGK